MRAAITSMSRAAAFLTPAAGGAAEPSPRDLWWFPGVGLALGGVIGAVWWVTSRAWPPTVSAALVVALDACLTGMLHLDGLADSADGLLAHGIPAERRLDVMAEPHIGAYAAVTVATVLLARWAALASAAPSALLLAGLWCASRTVMAAAVRTVPYARPGGLASAFRPQHSPRARPVGTLVLAIGGGLAALGCLLSWKLAAGAPVLAAAAVAGLALVALARRRLGGFTGDVLGAAGVLVETVGLVVAAARW